MLFINIIYGLGVILWLYLVIPRLFKKEFISERKQLILALIMLGIIIFIDIFELIV